LEDNDLLGIIRAHEVAHTGVLESYMCKEKGSFPLVVTVFSAPNYSGWYNNQAAIMILHEKGGYEYKYFEETKAPFVLPASLNGFTYSLPWISEQTYKFVVAFFGMLIDQLEDKAIAKQLQPKLAQLDKVAQSMHHVEEKNNAAVTLKGLRSTEGSDEIQIVNKLKSGEINFKDLDRDLELSPLATPKPKQKLNSKFWRPKNLSVDDSVYQAYSDITNRQTPINWAIFTYDDKSKKKRLVVKIKGTEESSSFIHHLIRNEPAWVYLSLSQQQTAQSKYVLINWIPDMISPLKRADSLIHKQTVQEIFSNISLEIQASDFSDIDREKLLQKLNSFGGLGYQ